MMKNLAVALNDVKFQWPKASAPCLHIQDWKVLKGERVFLYGPSGSGKSTLLNIIAGIHTPQYGEVDILGTQMFRLNRRQRDRFRARHIGVIFQQFNLIPYLSLQDNISLGQQFAGKPENRERLKRLLSELNLDQLPADQQVNQLSVGQQQRVAVARALYHQPEFIIADEPTSALDEGNRNGFIEMLLKQVAQTSSTLLFVSHDRTLAQHFDRHIDFTAINSAGQAHAN